MDYLEGIKERSTFAVPLLKYLLYLLDPESWKVCRLSGILSFYPSLKITPCKIENLYFYLFLTLQRYDYFILYANNNVFIFR